MAVSVLELSNGGVTLEFEVKDISEVRRVIRQLYGPMRRRWFVPAAQVTFGGERFVFQNVWSDPCLIASSPDGGEMLRRVAEELSAPS